MQFTGVDIVAEVGAFAPLVKKFTFVPSGRTMVIDHGDRQSTDQWY